MTRRRLVIRLVRLSLILLVLLWAFGLTALERRRMDAATLHPVRGTTQAPFADWEQLLADVQALTAAPMQGRLTGSPGSHLAQALIRDRFRAAGLQPVNGSSEQNFSFTHHSIKGLVTPGRPYQTEYPDATNLFGAIRGTAAPDSWIVLGAHYDHLGIRDGEVYPGADDNASGVATLLAAASYFARHPPRHSILFVAFDAEEQGLEGSTYFVKHPPVDLGRVHVMVNMDMVARGDDRSIVASGTSGDAQLRDLVAGAAQGRNVIVRFGHDRPMYLAGRIEDWTHAADHGPFHDRGVRTLYFGVEDHADYHRPTDTAGRIPLPFFGEAAAMMIDTVAAADAALVGPR